MKNKTTQHQSTFIRFFVFDWKNIRLLFFIYLLHINLYSCQNTTESSSQIVSSPLCASNAELPSLDRLSSPFLREQIGEAHLSITTNVREAQIWFDQGLNLLHGFWHLEAYRAFKEVVKHDPNCAMGYWGIAMCQPGFGSETDIWLDAIEQANDLKDTVTPIEKALIEATATLLEKGVSSALPKFKNALQQYPDEPNIIAFTALMMRQSVNSQAASDEVTLLLDDALERFPNHIGLQHYYLHVMEVRPDFLKAKPIALGMVEQTAAVPHLLHMPGHIYFLEGNYEQAAQAFEQARAKEQNYHQQENIPKIADQNYMHNLHYLSITYSELNEYEKSLSAAQEFSNISLHQETPKGINALILLYEGRILPARVNIRFQKYQEAADQISFWLHTPDFPIQDRLVRIYLQTMLDYCRAMQALQDYDIELAYEYGRQMNQSIQQFEQLGIQQEGTAAFPLISKTFDIINMTRFELAGWLDNFDANQTFNNFAWEKAFALESNLPYEEPPRLIAPVGESLMRLHQKRGDELKSKKAMESALRIRPKSKRIIDLSGNMGT